jgi:hypothetical protein
MIISILRPNKHILDISKDTHIVVFILKAKSEASPTFSEKRIGNIHTVSMINDILFHFVLFL